MKTLVYKIEGYNSIYNPQTGEMEQHLSLATVSIDNPTDTDIAQAQKNSYNGEYMVEEDKRRDPVEQPTRLDMVEAQITYTAMMTDTLLEV